MRLTSLLFPLLLSLPLLGQAQDASSPPPGAETGPVPLIDPNEAPEALKPVIAQLHPQHGTIAIGNGLATLNLPKTLAYLPPEEATFYMQRVVGYPRPIKNLGLILPADAAIGSPASWSTLITWREDGHIRESDIDASALMEQMKKGNEEQLAKARALGFEHAGAALLGWLENPTYDAVHHALIWCTEITQGDIDDDDGHQINFFIRILGRHGVLSLPIVAPLEQLPMISGNIPALIEAVHFNAPNRYEDSVAQDAQAPYNFSDLITGNRPPAKTAAPGH